MARRRRKRTTTKRRRLHTQGAARGKVGYATPKYGYFHSPFHVTRTDPIPKVRSQVSKVGAMKLGVARRSQNEVMRTPSPGGIDMSIYGRRFKLYKKGKRVDKLSF